MKPRARPLRAERAAACPPPGACEQAARAERAALPLPTQLRRARTTLKRYAMPRRAQLFGMQILGLCAAVSGSEEVPSDGCPEGSAMNLEGSCASCSATLPNQSSDGHLNCANGGVCVMQPGWGDTIPPPFGPLPTDPYYCDCPAGFIGFPEGMPDSCSRASDDCSCHINCNDCSVERLVATMRADPDDVLALTNAMDALGLALDGDPNSQIVSIRNPNPPAPAELPPAILESGALDLVVAAMADHQDDMELQRAGCHAIGGFAWHGPDFKAALRAAQAVDSVVAALAAFPPDASNACNEGECFPDKLQVQDCNQWGLQANCQAALGGMEVVHQDACSGTPCTDAAEFQGLLGPVNALCCDDPTEDCTSGVPSTCYEDCASVLLPLRNTVCATYLAEKENAAVKAIIDEAAACCHHNPGSEEPRDGCSANLPDGPAPPPAIDPTTPTSLQGGCVGSTLPATVQQCLQDCAVTLPGQRGDYREADVTITGNQTPSCAMGCFLFQLTDNLYTRPDVETCVAWCNGADNPSAGWGNGGCSYSIPDAVAGMPELMGCAETMDMCGNCPGGKCPHTGDCAFGCTLATSSPHADYSFTECWAAGGNYHYSSPTCTWARDQPSGLVPTTGGGH